MPRILVLCHSTYGHVETLANAVAEGARGVTGAEVEVKRVPELVPEEVARKSGYRLDQPAPIATVEELPGYDAIIVGVGTRYGRMASQMANFWDQNRTHPGAGGGGNRGSAGARPRERAGPCVIARVRRGR